MFKRALSSNSIHADFGLLLIRVGIGVTMLVAHGYDKITAGPELWTGIGGAMGNLGIGFAPVVWGFMAAFSEFVGSILLVLGTFFRTATLLLAFTMFVAAMMHLNLPADHPKTGLVGAESAILHLAIYLGLFFAGPGRYSFRVAKSEKR